MCCRCRLGRGRGGRPGLASPWDRLMGECTCCGLTFFLFLYLFPLGIPGMDGNDAAAEIIQERPGLKVHVLPEVQ